MKDTSPKHKHLIYLTGFMGCGKSTIGPILANTLGYAYADVDRVVEERVGKSVKDIFREHGEKFFREVERQVIEELSRRDHHVISLGGGSVVDPATFSVIKSSGILVYLYSSPEQLLKRLKHKTDRPVLSAPDGQNLNEEELREKVMQLFNAREPLYSQAHLTVHTDERRVGLTVDEIVRKLSHVLK
ncbi:MAG TPA: shikimate kinase [Bacteroidota bacterium]|nr:shikimate kinase [Bacteroidota bacterium]